MIIDGYLIGNVIEVLQKSQCSFALILDDVMDGVNVNICPRCFKSGRKEALYSGQKYCSVCGQRIGYPAVKESDAEY